MDYVDLSIESDNDDSNLEAPINFDRNGHVEWTKDPCPLEVSGLLRRLSGTGQTTDLQFKESMATNPATIPEKETCQITINEGHYPISLPSKGEEYSFSLKNTGAPIMLVEPSQFASQAFSIGSVPSQGHSGGMELSAHAAVDEQPKKCPSHPQDLEEQPAKNNVGSIRCASVEGPSRGNTFEVVRRRGTMRIRELASLYQKSSRAHTCTPGASSILPDSMPGQRTTRSFRANVNNMPQDQESLLQKDTMLGMLSVQKSGGSALSKEEKHDGRSEPSDKGSPEPCSSKSAHKREYISPSLGTSTLPRQDLHLHDQQKQKRVKKEQDQHQALFGSLSQAPAERGQWKPPDWALELWHAMEVQQAKDLERGAVDLWSETHVLPPGEVQVLGAWLKGQEAIIFEVFIQAYKEYLLEEGIADMKWTVRQAKSCGNAGLFYISDKMAVCGDNEELYPQVISPSIVDQIETLVVAGVFRRLHHEPTVMEIVQNLPRTLPCLKTLSERRVGPEDPRKGLVGQLDVKQDEGSRLPLEPGKLAGPYQGRHLFQERMGLFYDSVLDDAIEDWYRPNLPPGCDNEVLCIPQVRAGMFKSDVERYIVELERFSPFDRRWLNVKEELRVPFDVLTKADDAKIDEEEISAGVRVQVSPFPPTWTNGHRVGNILAVVNDPRVLEDGTVLSSQRSRKMVGRRNVTVIEVAGFVVPDWWLQKKVEEATMIRAAETCQDSEGQLASSSSLVPKHKAGGKSKERPCVSKKRDTGKGIHYDMYGTLQGAVGGWTFSFMVVIRTIQPGESLGYNYGPHYWPHIKNTEANLKNLIDSKQKDIELKRMRAELERRDQLLELQGIDGCVEYCSRSNVSLTVNSSPGHLPADVPSVPVMATRLMCSLTQEQLPCQASGGGLETCPGAACSSLEGQDSAQYQYPITSILNQEHKALHEGDAQQTAALTSGIPSIQAPQVTPPYPSHLNSMITSGYKNTSWITKEDQMLGSFCVVEKDHSPANRGAQGDIVCSLKIQLDPLGGAHRSHAVESDFVHDRRDTDGNAVDSSVNVILDQSHRHCSMEAHPGGSINNESLEVEEHGMRAVAEAQAAAQPLHKQGGIVWVAAQLFPVEADVQRPNHALPMNAAQHELAFTAPSNENCQHHSAKAAETKKHRGGIRWVEEWVPDQQDEEALDRTCSMWEVIAEQMEVIHEKVLQCRGQVQDTLDQK
ncbi:hypothetical protein CEUSTIGMA_g4680.t1 [Chlamydomonas eustigma]|uniref:SET domain-containing protein n=1 Tax=Chlamydomonas eustigma TaxID=1157962 RepID=A0A250X2B1_9CHLO|nr:hypothetical protein CEUSTIGMA_g4680.t1 [Chlamydomonas eustigma]|eukprot:GAX77234.1 hypothetical protein CEUSTIGMA_g4680.t1 [Chlamydomonas eustigma]